MKCSDARPLLDLMNDGALEAKDCALVLDHLKTCRQCQAEWNELESLRSRFIEAKEKSQMSGDLMNRIAFAIKNEEATARERDVRRLFQARSFVAMAAAVLLAGIVYFSWQHSGGVANSPQTVAMADTLVDDLALANSVQQVDDKNQLGKMLGFDPKFIPLGPWHMDKVNVYRSPSQLALARFDFIRKGDSGDEHLTCYQGQLGTIKAGNGSQRLVGDKRVVFGNHGQMRYALFSQNGRDYLFVTAQSASELETIVRGA